MYTFSIYIAHIEVLTVSSIFRCRCLLAEGVRCLKIQQRPCLCRNFDRLLHKVTMQFAVMGIVIQLIKWYVAGFNRLLECIKLPTLCSRAVLTCTVAWNSTPLQSNFSGYISFIYANFFPLSMFFPQNLVAHLVWLGGYNKPINLGSSAYKACPLSSLVRTVILFWPASACCPVMILCMPSLTPFLILCIHTCGISFIQHTD